MQINFQRGKNGVRIEEKQYKIIPIISYMKHQIRKVGVINVSSMDVGSNFMIGDEVSNDYNNTYI